MDINEDKEVSNQTSANSLSKCIQRDNADVRTGRWDADAKLRIRIHNSVNFNKIFHIILHTDIKFVVGEVRMCGCVIPQSFASFQAFEIMKKFAHICKQRS